MMRLSTWARATRLGGLLVALSVLLLGCADEESSVPTSCDSVGAGGTSGSGGEGGSIPPNCASGSIVGPDGACMAVGIQGCVERFIEDDGLCHPRMDKCPAGTIPKFDEGCVPVGIPPSGCAQPFMEEDGLCHPRMDKCPAGSFAAPLLGCVPIDGPDGCGTSTWGPIADGPDTVWVDPAYAGGDGVGTQVQPFATIAAGLAAAAAGGRVALAAGDYDEPIHITKPVEIVGRCASLVTISGIQPTSYGYIFLGVHDDAIVLVEAADGVTLRNMSLSGPGYGVIAVSATVLLEGVHIHEATACGVFAREGADVSLERCLIEDTQAPADPHWGGSGMMAFTGSRVTVSHSALYHNRSVGLWAEQDSSLIAQGVLVESMRPSLDYGIAGDGLSVATGAHMEVSSSGLVDCCANGAHVDGAELELIDSVVERTRPCDDGGSGNGVVVRSDGWARVDGCAVVDNAGDGILVSDAVFEGRGNLVRGQTAAKPGLGAGLKLQASRAAWVDNAVVDNEGTGASCTDGSPGLLVEGNLFEANGAPEPPLFIGASDGLGIYDTEDALLRSNAAIDNYGTGITVCRSKALLLHNLVEASRATHYQILRCGEGLRVDGAGAVAEVDGLAAVGNSTRGIWLGDAEQVALRRTLVRGTQPRPMDGELGCGVVVEGCGDAQFEDVVAMDNHLTAMLVQSSSLTLRSSRLADTHEGRFTSQVCPIQPCPWNKASLHQGIADGLIAASSTVQLGDVHISGCSRAGALFHASSGSIEGLESTHNGFGIVLQGSPLPEMVADSCVLAPNTEQDVLTDSDLAVPDESSELPEAPAP